MAERRPFGFPMAAFLEAHIEQGPILEAAGDTIDFRHPDGAVLDHLGGQMESLCRAHVGDCAVRVTETMDSPPIAFDSAVVGHIRDAAERQGVTHYDMISGATHDAKFMAGLCPAGMIFVPCAGGGNHSEAESAAAADLAAGARILADVMVTLVNG